jgi:methyl-accepting chemotaxis protein
MGGETGQLQRLSEEQVRARLSAYNGGGALDRDVKLLRDNVADIIAEEIVAQFGKERAERFASVYNDKVDAAWIQNVAEYGRQLYAEQVPVPSYMLARTQAMSRIVGRMVERYGSDGD